jgi:hypothetical protein
MAENYSNDFSTTLSAGINNSVTSFTVASSTGAPSPNFRIRVDDEIMLVTGVAGTTWTVTRGQESTTAASHSSGAIVVHVLTAGALTVLFGEKEPVIAAGTTGQYWRGDKSWQTLDKTAVGLSNVDNTSDANKPVSTATSTALGLKYDKTGGAISGDVELTGADRRIKGDFTSALGAGGAAFQTSSTNQFTAVKALPSGTNTASYFQLFNSSSGANCAVASFAITNAAAGFSSLAIGSGTLLPMTFNVGAERMRLTTDGDISMFGATPSSGGTTYRYLTLGSGTTGSAGTILEFKDSAGAARSYIVSNAGAGLQLQVATALPISFQTNNVERFRIDGSANRFIAKFDDSVVANRMLFQTSSTNQYTALCAIPSGTAQAAYMQLFNRADPSNAASLSVFIDNTQFGLYSGSAGTGTTVPMVFNVAGERMRITTVGGVLFSTATEIAGDYAGRVQIVSSSPGSPIVMRNSLSTAGKLWSNGPDSSNNFYVLNQSGAGMQMIDGATAWSAVSDIDMKKDLVPIDGAELWGWFKTVRTMNGKYRYDEYERERSFLIAQDWTDKPDVVSADEAGILSMAASNTLPYFGAVLKEAMRRIEVLEATIN